MMADPPTDSTLTHSGGNNSLTHSNSKEVAMYAWRDALLASASASLKMVTLIHPLTYVLTHSFISAADFVLAVT